MPSPPDFIQNINLTELEADPGPFYARLRKEAPLAFVPTLGLWVASTKELCTEIAQDPETWPAVISPSSGRTFGPGAILDANGEQHRELRDMVDPHLQPVAVDGYIDDLVRPFARSLLAEFENDGKAEIVSAYCEPVSVRALGDLLGLKEVSTDKLREWFHKLSASATNAAVDEDGEFANPDGFVSGDEARAEIIDVVDPLIEKWTKEPDHSAISHWLHDGMPEGHTRSKDIIYPNLYVFLLGAMQEPGHAMATTLAGLLSRPDQLERVIDDPSLIPRAVSEGVRWVAPIWSVATKRAARDVTINGITVPEGAAVMLAYGSANQDELAYSQPDTYDLDRVAAPHLAFGTGAHACAGTYFANAVVRIALEELMEAIPNVERDPTHDINFWGWGFRGLKELFVRWEA